MFTGIVEETGEVVALQETPGGARLLVRASIVSQDARIGESIAVNGACLTVAARHAGEVSFDLLDETLRLTNLKHGAPGSLVNLERALRADGRLGGHFVQGHVDCTGAVRSFEKVG